MTRFAPYCHQLVQHLVQRNYFPLHQPIQHVLGSQQYRDHPFRMPASQLVLSMDPEIDRGTAAYRVPFPMEAFNLPNTEATNVLFPPRARSSPVKAKVWAAEPGGVSLNQRQVSSAR